jgi:XTP/dITP diphosphohydrolase
MSGSRLLIATTNQGKIREYREILDILPVELITPADIGLSLDVEETGETFRANSDIKAKAFFEASGLVTFSEDSGLEIDALDGAPGVYSARWGGTSDYAVKNQRVLDLLAEVPVEKRTARYVSEATVVDLSGKRWHYRGTVSGRLGYEIVGEGGFGYDPIFYIPRFRRTMAQLSAVEKHEISHRGRSTRRALPRLRAILGV